MANPLVAGPVDTTTATSGAGVVDDLLSLSDALGSGSWLTAGMSGVGAALDVAATVSDPLGSLIAAGLGWLMDHLEPLKGWLDDLTGDAGAVLGFAGTWDNVAKSMGNAGDELARVVRTDLEAMSGSSIAAYGAYAARLADHVKASGGSASAMGSALRTCAQVVQAVHDLVRDTLAQLVGSIVSWAAEAVFSLGLATPWIVEQVSTRVASLAARIGRSVKELVESAGALRKLLDALKDVLARVGPALRRGARAGERDVPSTLPRTAARPGFRDDGTIDPAAFRTEPDTAYFWSGRLADGTTSVEPLARGAAADHGGTTLEALVESRRIEMPEWDPRDAAVQQVWADASAAYADGASGTVRAVVGPQLRPGNIWTTVERPRLEASPAVTRIIEVDAVTRAERQVYP